MIDFNSVISDESLSAFVEGNANSFEKLKINSALPTSSNLSEVIDITNDIKSIDLDTLPIEDFGIDLSTLNLEELKHKIK